MSVRFGDCRFDADARRCFRQSSEVHLSPKAFELVPGDKILVSPFALVFRALSAPGSTETAPERP